MMNFSHESIDSLPQLIAWFDEQQHKIAQELHDSILQQQIILLRQCEQLLENEHVWKEYDIQHWYEALQDLIYETRELCQKVRNPFITPISLHANIMQLSKYMSLHTNIDVQIDYEIFEDDIENEQKLNIWRIIQELMYNAIKHSKATWLRLTIKRNHNFLNISYQDNGVGANITPSALGKTMGLSGIYYRVKALSGSCEFESEQGGGFKFSMKAPLVDFIEKN